MSANRLKKRKIIANTNTRIWTVGISAPKIDSKASLPNPLIAKTDSVMTEPPNLFHS